MPQIQTPTARGAGGTIRLAPVSPNSFGAQAGAEATQFGQSLLAVDAKLQAQRDELDLVGKVGDYNIRLAQLPAEVMADPTLATTQDRVAAYKEQADTYRETLNTGASMAVQRALSVHAVQALSTGIIQMETADRTRQVQQLRADSTTMQDRLSAREAQQIASGQSELALATRNERLALLSRSVERGVHNPQEALAEDARAQNQTWESVAQQNPDYILHLSEEVLTGQTPPAGMDPQKLPNYVNIAVNTLHAQQIGGDRALKAQEAQVKATQDANARTLTADLLEGKPIGAAIPSLLRSRGLDDATARTLHALQQQLISAPDLSQYQRGLASQIEASLGALKYSPGGLQEGIEQGIQSDYLQGHLLKDEFTHLMGVLRSVEDYKHQAGKESHNQDVTHAHTNLVQRLRTTGPADKFDALSEQTVAEAGQFFYRRMGQEPTADPWKVMQEAETIFKPAIEKRLGLSKADTAVLDDARMQALKHSKAISPAAYKAYQERTQEQRGWNAVQDAIKALPPPPQPGFFERLNPFTKPTTKTERKPSGVMGGE